MSGEPEWALAPGQLAGEELERRLRLRVRVRRERQPESFEDAPATRRRRGAPCAAGTSSTARRSATRPGAARARRRPGARTLRPRDLLEDEGRAEDAQILERDARPARAPRRTRAVPSRRACAPATRRGPPRGCGRSPEATSSSPSRRSRRASRRPRRCTFGERRTFVGQLVGHDGPQLHDRVAVAPAHAARAHDDAGLVQPQVGRVEEEDLPDLRLQRIELERA